MISGTTGRAGRAAGLDRGLEDRAGLHLGDLGIGDGEPAAAEAEHRVELVQLARARAAASRRKGRARSRPPAISASVCGRNSCSGGSSRRIVTGKPAMIVEELDEIVALHRQELRERGAAAASSSARIISRIATMRSPSKNMCSVRQRPMPSAPNSRAVRASCGVSALARTFMRRTLSAQAISVANSPDSSGSSIGTSPFITSPGRAVDGDDVALLEGLAHDGQRLRRVVDADRAGAGDAGLAHAARDDGRVGGHAAARRQDALGGVHAVDVLGRGLDAHENDLAPGLLRALGFVGREHDLARRRAGRGGQAGGEDVPLRLRIDRRVQELVERRGIDALHRLVCGDQALARHLDGDAHRGLRGALAVARLQHLQLALFDRELDVLHVAVVPLENAVICTSSA